MQRQRNFTYKRLPLTALLVILTALLFTSSCKQPKDSRDEPMEAMESGEMMQNPTENEMHQMTGDEIHEEMHEATKDEMHHMTDDQMRNEMHRSRPTVNILPDQIVSSPLKVRLNTHGHWMGHEGEVGWAKLLDNSGNELSSGILKAEGEWMKSGPVMYSTVLEFDAGERSAGKLVIQQNPGPGDGDEAGTSETLEIPVTF